MKHLLLILGVFACAHLSAFPDLRNCAHTTCKGPGGRALFLSEDDAVFPLMQIETEDLTCLYGTCPVTGWDVLIVGLEFVDDELIVTDSPVCVIKPPNDDIHLTCSTDWMEKTLDEGAKLHIFEFNNGNNRGQLNVVEFGCKIGAFWLLHVD